MKTHGYGRWAVLALLLVLAVPMRADARDWYYNHHVVVRSYGVPAYRVAPRYVAVPSMVPLLCRNSVIRFVRSGPVLRGSPVRGFGIYAVPLWVPFVEGPDSLLQPPGQDRTLGCQPSLAAVRAHPPGRCPLTRLTHLPRDC